MIVLDIDGHKKIQRDNMAWSSAGCQNKTLQETVWTAALDSPGQGPPPAFHSLGLHWSHLQTQDYKESSCLTPTRLMNVWWAL